MQAIEGAIVRDEISITAAKGHVMKKLKDIGLQTSLYVISACILLAGLSSAVLIYQSAMNDSDSELGYEVVGGTIYPGRGEYSKKYVHDLQVFGGTSAVLADEFMRWWSGLWQGKTLAFTVACIAIILSFCVFVAANNVPPRIRSDGNR